MEKKKCKNSWKKWVLISLKRVVVRNTQEIHQRINGTIRKDLVKQAVASLWEMTQKYQLLTTILKYGIWKTYLLLALQLYHKKFNNKQRQLELLHIALLQELMNIETAMAVCSLIQKKKKMLKIFI